VHSDLLRTSVVERMLDPLIELVLSQCHMYNGSHERLPDLTGPCAEVFDSVLWAIDSPTAPILESVLGNLRGDTGVTSALQRGMSGPMRLARCTLGNSLPIATARGMLKHDQGSADPGRFCGWGAYQLHESCVMWFSRS
jgi:hypothetical protein